MDSHSHYIHGVPTGEGHYSQQQQQQQGQQWTPQQQQQSHLLPPAHSQSAFPSPSSPSSTLSEQHYPSYYPQQQQQPAQPGGQSAQPQQQGQQQGAQSAISSEPMDKLVDRSHTSLSLNLSSLTVTSPTNLSPINPSPHPSTHASSHVSPITPISPAGLQNTALATHHQQHAQHHATHMHQQHPFQFAAPDHGVRYDDAPYDYTGARRLTSSRSSSSSEKSVPRKRSFTTVTPLATSVEEAYDQSSNAMDTSPYDEVDMVYSGLDADGSPIDGSTSGGEQDDQLKPLQGQLPSGNSAHAGVAPSLSILGKPLGTNNFVTKLYQMINDPKSAQFINWTELGTSFVVSNVGEFSRTILGSHFKHNNFSSFVRQLNMYGFHKINRTPRAQRTSTDMQTWEFSHHKFLRGRPDLLEEIKRKALEPDPSLKQRVELPGEVAAQLSQMREENRRLVLAFHTEKNKVDRLTHVTKVMYDVISKAFPANVPLPFPSDLLEASDSPNIFVTSPTSSGLQSHFPPSISSLSNPSLHSLHSLSPSSSPTAAEFPSHTHTPHTLSRQHSFQHIPYDNSINHIPHSHHSHHHGVSSARYEPALSTPLPPSPGPMEFGDDPSRLGSKRQRTGALATSTTISDNSTKKGLRARSDSAPLGYGLNSAWTQTRPRSGSGMAPQRGTRRDELPVPNIGSLSRGNSTLPMLTIPKQPAS